MSRLKAVILAAGKGTRMKSDLPKVLHEIDGKPLVEYVIEAARAAGAEDICLVIGHQAELVKERIGDGVTYVLQEEQLGTGHAVKCAADFIGLCGMQTVISCGLSSRRMQPKRRSRYMRLIPVCIYSNRQHWQTA